ncbi:hypothetical protein [Maricaulis sp.]|uniref:hypothetical protein n=1 Tax=Maricaulis sp. TaxID=1486257 RepID=UPI000C4FAA94|nr:hypothetical protein [Maricaulis sp.]MAC89851.1 hypothetical protein [Maricaulis sp.]
MILTETKSSKTMLMIGCAFGLAANTGAALAQSEPDILLNARLRYEQVDQEGFADRANALTLRTRLGIDSGEIEGFRFLVEAENVLHLVDDFNSSTNGRTGFPVVADPEETELNRLQVSFTGLSDMVAVLGRQRVVLGDARHVGNVGFRQNEQTFDAFRLTWTGQEGGTFNYLYLDRVHRIFGDDHPAGEWDLDAHLFDGDYTTRLGTFGGFVYLVDNQDVAALSTATFGARWSGQHVTADDANLAWLAEYARQSDRGDNPASFDLDLFRAQVSLAANGWSGAIGFESLEGDGVRGFSTPLATLHAYQGWADVFLTTPANGIRDAYVRFGWAAAQSPIGESLSAAVIFHDFEAGNGGGDLGSEIDAVVTTRLSAHYALELKAAFYNGPAGGPADRDKVWLAFTVNY